MPREILTVSESDEQFPVYDQYTRKSYSEIYSDFLAWGMTVTEASSKASLEYEKEQLKTIRVLHTVTYEEIASLPKGIKNKPNHIGRYSWRAPAFQSLLCGRHNNDPFIEYAELLLGCLKPGDKLPVKLRPKSPFGHYCEILTFEKYSHRFPTKKYWLHSETLTFRTENGKHNHFSAMPVCDYSDSNFGLICGVAEVLSHWNMCRLSNEEIMFGSLYDILKREKTLSWKRDFGMCYNQEAAEDTENVFEQPLCMFRTL